MRLIDADALLEQYNLKDATKYGNKDAEQQAHSYSTMMLYEIADMIEDAPTAYDVDKVVEQLEDYGNEEMDYYRNTPYEKCIEECVHKAIEIVKGGGVNDKTKQTNADRIRNMSDEELAEFIEQISTDSMETISFGTKEYKEIWERKETALEWLQSEVEEDYQLDGLKEKTEEDREV